MFLISNEDPLSLTTNLFTWNADPSFCKNLPSLVILCLSAASSNSQFLMGSFHLRCCLVEIKNKQKTQQHISSPPVCPASYSASRPLCTRVSNGCLIPHPHPHYILNTPRCPPKPTPAETVLVRCSLTSRSPNPKDAFLDLSAALRTQMFTPFLRPSFALYSLEVSLLPYQMLFSECLVGFFSSGEERISPGSRLSPHHRATFLQAFQTHLYTMTCNFLQHLA